MDVYERYYIAPPSANSEAVRKGLVDPSDRTKMLRGLRERLDLNKVVVITAVSGPEGIALRSRSDRHDDRRNPGQEDRLKAR